MIAEAPGDRRVARTIESLRTALIELILEKHYDAITVQDIIDRANVGRSTFYTHFRDKEDLLVGDWQKLLSFFAVHINVSGDADISVAPIEALMMHLKEYHGLYRALVRSGKAERLFMLGVEFLTEKIAAKIDAETALPDVPSAVSANFLGTQIFATLNWWLDHNMPYTPAEMDAMFHKLAAPGFRRSVVTA